MAFTAEDVPFLRLLAKSTDPQLAEAARAALDAVVLKWTYNPNQSRVGGRFSSGTGGNTTTAQPKPARGPKPINAAAAANVAGKRPVNPAAARIAAPQAPPAASAPAGAQASPAVAHTSTAPVGETLEIGHRSTAQTRAEAGRQASAQHTADMVAAKEVATIRAALAATKVPGWATTKQRDTAVAAMERKYGIPKSTKGMSAKRKAAVAAMRSATRKLVTSRAEQARTAARIAAIQAQLKTAKSAQARVYLQKQLDVARKYAAKYAAKTKANKAAFNAAKKAWQS